jgi:hypothetical protein
MCGMGAKGSCRRLHVGYGQGHPKGVSMSLNEVRRTERMKAVKTIDQRGADEEPTLISSFHRHPNRPCLCITMIWFGPTSDLHLTV